MVHRPNGVLLEHDHQRSLLCAEVVRAQLRHLHRRPSERVRLCSRRPRLPPILPWRRLLDGRCSLSIGKHFVRNTPGE